MFKDYLQLYTKELLRGEFSWGPDGVLGIEAVFKADGSTLRAVLLLWHHFGGGIKVHVFYEI